MLTYGEILKRIGLGICSLPPKDQDNDRIKRLFHFVIFSNFKWAPPAIVVYVNSVPEDVNYASSFRENGPELFEIFDRIRMIFVIRIPLLVEKIYGSLVSYIVSEKFRNRHE